MTLIARLALSLGLAACMQAQEPVAWWAYQPLVRPAVPQGHEEQAIDAFLAVERQRLGLIAAPEVDRATLLRRVTYDLTGLPPTAEEQAAFLADSGNDAYERVIDRLLASPHYGEKWARHWMDLVRYADTDGYERDRSKPFAWRYRDWLVQSLQADMPYDQFVLRQLAGDELAHAKVDDLIATGYYRMGTWDDEPSDPLQHRYDDLDGIADTTARTFLGVSMGCARCHDHKKDPLTQREYYAFLAYFENIKPYDLQARMVPATGSVADHEAALTAHAARHAELAAQLRAAATAPAAPDRELHATLAWFPGTPSHPLVLHDACGGAAGTIHGQVVACEGVVGEAMRFDGDDFVALPRLVADSFTVSFFVRSTQRGEGNDGDNRWFTGTGLIDAEVPGIVHDWGIAWHSNGRIVAGVGNPDRFLASGPDYHDGKWHHVAFTRDAESGAAVLFVDGVKVADNLGSKEPLLAPKRILVGRAQPGGRGFRGDLDELRFFSRALSTAEVIALALQLPVGTAGMPELLTQPGVRAACEQLTALQRPVQPTLPVLAVAEQGANAEASFVRLRGNVHSKGAAVQLGVPSMLASLPGPQAPVPLRNSTGRRTALAQWLVRPDHPLTWRVIANRLWQHHFGRGLVRSTNDFGQLGDLPTNQPLLDWLACEMVARGGSLKSMHRLLLSSRAYRMVAAPHERNSARDPSNDHFWRFDRRRLTAEEVRDSILAAAGTLHLQLGGPTVFPTLPNSVLATASRPEEAWGQSPPEQQCRRSLYVHSKRSLQVPLLAGFDQADTDNSCPVRFATVQPTQALTLWNGEFVHQQAERMAARLAAAHQDLRAQVAMGLQLVTQRQAHETDIARLVTLHEQLRRDHGASEARALQRICLVLLNCNEFLYLD